MPHKYWPLLVGIRCPGAGQPVCSVIPWKSFFSFPISNRRASQRSPEREVGEQLLHIEPPFWGGWLGAQQAVTWAVPEQKDIWSACGLTVKRCTLGKWLLLNFSICQLVLAGPSLLNTWEDRYDNVYSLYTEELFLFLESLEGKNRCKGLLGLSFYTSPDSNPYLHHTQSIEEWLLLIGVEMEYWEPAVSNSHHALLTVNV